MYNQAKRVPYKYVDFTKSPSCLLALLGVSDSRMNDRLLNGNPISKNIIIRLLLY